AIISIPFLLLLLTKWMTISPVCAYSMIFRAISEIAVAINVSVPPLNPISAAKARPFCRATTISLSEFIGTRISFCNLGLPLDSLFQVSESFFEVKGRCDVFKREAQLDHGKSHFRLYADDDGFGAPELHH